MKAAKTRIIARVGMTLFTLGPSALVANGLEQLRRKNSFPYRTIPCRSLTTEITL